jgi:parallel beta-helix repeat protein
MNKNIIYILVLGFILIGAFGLAFNAKWAEASPTIYIQADGSINPPTANITSTDNVTYTFTDDITDSIIIQRGNITLDGAGHKLQGSGSGTGIQISVSGFEENITITNIEITLFTVGIDLTNTGYVTLSANKIENCSYNGIAFGESFNLVIYGNTITNNTNGIGGNTFTDTVISENTITNNTNGILFNYAQNNIIYLNNITNNEYGIYMEGMNVYDNTFYHNNFINNTNQVYIEETNPNVWDDGYPSGGNYWSDFQDIYPLVGDNFSGADQNETGSDGIWDGPYVIDGNNTDRYPLTTLIPEFPAWTSIISVFAVLTIATIIFKKKLTKNSALQPKA